MPQQGTPGYLKYRVLDSNTGAVVIPDLPHLHQSTWTVRALQSGYPGSTTIGDFRIPLPPPQSDLFRRSKLLYDQLAIGQKIEGYLGDVITGSPRFSGVATKVNKSLGQPWEVAGSDTLWWLQQSQVNPGEVFDSTLTGANLVSTLRTTQEVISDDDFSNWNSGSIHPNSSDYTNSGWSFTSSDPYLGAPALTSTTVGPAIAALTTHNTWSRGSEYENGGLVTIQGTMVAGTDTANDACEAAIFFLSDSTGANGMMFRARMLQTGVGTGLYNVHAEIYNISAGTYTQVAQVLNVFTNVGAVFPFEVTALNYIVAGTDFHRILINGKDPNCVYSATSPPFSSGSIGLRFSPASGGSPTVYVNRLQFRSRDRTPFVSRFAAGTVAGGSRNLLQKIVGSGQSHLDVMLLASALDGWWIRKNPGAGFKADSIDYGPSPGTDLSSAILFEEGVNVLDQNTAVASVADLFATDLKMQAIPGSDGGGNITWRRIGANGDMVLVDSAYDLGVPGYSLLRSYAQQIQARKVNPMQAIQVNTVRTADTADKWRELDFVTVHIPTLGVYRQKAQVVGYTFTEGGLSQVLYLNQFPERQLPQAPLQRFARALDYLTLTYQQR